MDSIEVEPDPILEEWTEARDAAAETAASDKLEHADDPEAEPALEEPEAGALNDSMLVGVRMEMKFAAVNSHSSGSNEARSGLC